ncbi:MAG: (2Fe-2S)-binding protein, partial [bacterium]|nr:(2Fe-2S)-binding protein [bacterium]
MNVTITIDGRTLCVEEGMNVLEAALQNGIYIPHLCHHPDLPELGSCRLCIVELEGQEGVQPSCKLRAAEGMVIRTKSDQISKLRNLSMELLLAAHPEDCSTCPKYGKCELQTLIQYMGVSATRMTSRIKGLKMDERNPLIV